MPTQNRMLSLLLRLLGAFVVLSAVIFVFIPPSTIGRDARLLACLSLVAGLAIGMMLWGLSVVLSREAQTPAETRNALARLEHQVVDLQGKLRELYILADRTSRGTPDGRPAPKDYAPQLESLATAINEVRELSLLPDAERRQRSHLDRQNRKLRLLSELFALVSSAEWAKAERLLISLQTDFPNDDDVAKGRSYLEHSRNLVEAHTIRDTTREIEELMASSSWDRAWERVRALVEGFPASSDARALHNRIQREHDAYCDTSAQRIFEGIRHDIDQRNWRQAVSRSEQLFAQFPTHRVTESLRPRLKTLRENAEIQERQELEVRIQELMHDSQFDQAIELAEDLIRRYPLSPQADSLETLLPRIRELAREGVAVSNGVD